jgi:PAS domain S-box-containing protein
MAAGRLPGRDVPDLVLGTLLADAVDSARLGLFVYDEHGKYIAVNRCGAELLGYDRDELMRRDVGDFTPAGMDRSVLQRPERREGVRRIRRKDGSETTVAFLVVPTDVSLLQFHLAVVWELDADDPRAAEAV